MVSRPFPTRLPAARPERDDDVRLADLSTELLAVLDADGRVRRGNRAWSSVLPWSATAAGVADVRAHVHPDDHATFDQALHTLLGGGVVDDVVVHLDDGTGGYRRITWTGRPDPEAGVVAIRGRDVTDQHRDACEHERRAARLQRTNDDLQEFAYVASHDLSEPLRMVTSYLDLIRRRYDDQLDEAGREFIHYAVDGAHRMRALIDDLLVYSRVGAADVRRDLVDLDAVMADVRHDLAAAIDEARAHVRWSDLGTVRGDATQFGQLLQNLVANAVKFRGEEAPVVEITRETTDDHVVLRVRDNGIGIDPRYVERIFQVFARLHPRAEYAGTGIGLSICRRIVERHGGTISVVSAQGEGTTFVITLPIEHPGEPLP